MDGTLGLRDSSNEETPQDTNTGNSLLHSRQRSLSPLSVRYLATNAMPSSLAPRPRSPTYSRMTPLLRALGLSGEQSPSEEMLRPTGSQYGPPPSPEIWQASQRMYALRATGPSSALELIMNQCLLWYECATFTGVPPVQVNLVGRGMKQDWTLTLRIPGPNFGVVIKLKQMLSLMNFEAELTSPICSDGLIDIQYVWKSREEVGR